MTASRNDVIPQHRVPRGRRPKGSNGLPQVWCTASGTWKDSMHGGVVIPEYTGAQMERARHALSEAKALGVELVTSRASSTGFKGVVFDRGRVDRPRKFKCTLSATGGRYFTTAEEAALAYALRLRGEISDDARAVSGPDEAMFVTAIHATPPPPLQSMASIVLTEAD